jgi:hypothetical protein
MKAHTSIWQAIEAEYSRYQTLKLGEMIDYRSFHGD